MAFLVFWSAALPSSRRSPSPTWKRQAGPLRQHPGVGSVGFILAVLGPGYLLDDLPIRTVLWVTLATLGGNPGLPAMVIPEARRPAHGPASAPGHDPAAARGAFAAAPASSCRRPTGALRLYSLHLVEHGYSKTLVGWMWTLGVMAEIAVFMGMPQLLRAFSLRHPGVQLCGGDPALSADRLGAGFPGVAVVRQLLHGATFGAYHAAAVAAVNEWFGAQHQARGQALCTAASLWGRGMIGGGCSRLHLGLDRVGLDVFPGRRVCVDRLAGARRRLAGAFRRQQV